FLFFFILSNIYENCCSGTQFTDFGKSIPDGKRLFQETRVLMLKIEGDFPCLRARSAHFIGHLPVSLASVTQLLR
ncbi:MAG TPA: hypothetical protein VH164_02825, partial [Ktedonobacteraceae bacterium]|nr:hypothetical protein [Ktedonobacteraceae bacterium]